MELDKITCHAILDNMGEAVYVRDALQTQLRQAQKIEAIGVPAGAIGACAYIKKPIIGAKLAKTVRRALDEKEKDIE